MIQEKGTITIDRPIAVVFDFLVDGLNNRHWRTSVIDVQSVPSKPNTFKQGMKGPGGRVDGDYEITEIRPNEVIRMRTIAGMVRPTGTYEFETADKGTRVTYSLHFDGKGPAKLMEPMVAQVMRSEIAMLPNLKKYLESN